MNGDVKMLIKASKILYVANEFTHRLFAFLTEFVIRFPITFEITDDPPAKMTAPRIRIEQEDDLRITGFHPLYPFVNRDITHMKMNNFTVYTEFSQRLDVVQALDKDGNRLIDLAEAFQPIIKGIEKRGAVF